MYIIGETLDDILRRVFGAIIKSGDHVQPSRGECSEKVGALLVLKNPRARLSRTERRGETLFSALGELCWYLAGSKQLPFIEYYIKQYAKESDDGKTLYGAYGPRLLRMRGTHNQVKNVLKLLKRNGGSRRAVIQLFDAADLARAHTEVPCTCTFQFLLRRGRLLMVTHMRSNDAYKGLPHDVFAFTMLQELMARSLGVEPGEYRHAVGSLHLYKTDFEAAQQFVKEGWQPTAATMPSMPLGDQWSSVRKMLEAEGALRRGDKAIGIEDGLAPYWADIVRLLRIFRAFRNRDESEVRSIRRTMSSRMFDRFIERKQVKAGRKTPPPSQPELFDALTIRRRRARR